MMCKYLIDLYKSFEHTKHEGIRVVVVILKRIRWLTAGFFIDLHHCLLL
jgi:hypothetical protein